MASQGINRVAVSVLALALSSAAAPSGLFARNSSSCKAIPGDPTWPGPEKWAQLNATVEGRLIASVPLAAVCHVGGYGPVQENNASCIALQDIWNLPATYEPSPPDIMQPYFQNATCNPYYDRDEPCTLGNLVSYAINVSNAADVAAGIKFASDNNVRLVIKNTGHDFLGKSTGKGGLSLWTHNLKYNEFTQSYNGTGNYSGPAVRLGGGWTGGEIELLVHSQGFRAVTGDCPTVGLVGGYAQGGGHSLLNGVYGMAADNVLEWEVVTANGTHLTATPYQNSDLYYAMCGGGGGTYAVALSVTYKIHPDGGPIGAAYLVFNRTAAPDNATYAKAIALWWEFLPTVLDTGVTNLFQISGDQFILQNTTAVNWTGEQVGQLYAPYLAQLANLSVPYNFTTYTSNTYFDHFDATNGPLPDGVYPTTELFNSRLIPRSVTQSYSRSLNLTNAMLTGIAAAPDAGFFFGCSGQNTSLVPHPANGVTPHWRNAVAICINIALYDWYIPQSEMLARRATMANVLTPLIEAATPDGGAYLNEADPLVYPPNNPSKWKKDFYGAQYPTLKAIKEKWDPKSVFYANTAVGSDAFYEDADGRICRA